MRDLLESLLMADNAETLRVVLAEDTYPGFKVRPCLTRRLFPKTG